MDWNPPIALRPREEKLCRRLEKHRRFYRFLRLHRHLLFDDSFQAQLALLHPKAPRGTPPKPPALLAMVVLLQAYAGVSDADAVQLAETDARWQMVLDCLGAEEAPFGKSTLVDFRSQLLSAGLHLTLLRRTVELARQTGDFGPVQAASLRVALDSVPLEGAGKVEDTLNLLGRALRLLVHSVAALLLLTPEQLYAQAQLRVLTAKSIKAGLDRDWDAPGATQAALKDLLAEIERFENWLQKQRSQALSTYEVAAAQAQLARLLEQDTQPDGQGGRRLQQGVAKERQISLSDPEMRHGRKSQTERIDGYKQYLAVELDSGLTLAACVLPANVPEAKGADKLRPQVESYGKVSELHVDRAFLSSAWVGELATENVETIVGRGFASTNRGFYPKRAFRVELTAGLVRCPAGQEAVIRGEVAHFAVPVCRACPQRASCQKPGAKQGRSIHISPNERLLQHLSVAASTEGGRKRLRERVKVEHALSHQKRRQFPQARYRGVAKNDFDACRIAAVNNLLVMDRKLREAEVAPMWKAAS